MISVWIGLLALIIFGLMALNRPPPPRRVSAFSVPIPMATHRACDFSTVGESFHLKALEALVDWDEGDAIKGTAILRPENNPHDADAVAVEIQGRTVSYLAHEQAVLFRWNLQQLGIEDRVTSCMSRVHRWRPQDAQGAWRYSVTLGLVWPPAIAVPGEPEYLLHVAKDGRRQKRH